MPQTTVLQEWKNNYPLLAPAQKPGGVTISTTLIANAVPNKPQPWTPSTITAPFVVESSEVAATEEEAAPEEVHEEEETEEENDENGHPKPTARRGSQHRRRR